MVTTSRHLERVGSRIRSMMSDATLVSKISVAVNILLTILKLSVGILFNSVALLADGFDNLIDVVSAIAVFLGIKHRRELYSTGFIIAVMFGTSLWIVYESISRIVRPEVVDTGWLIVVAAVCSGIVCYVMSVYQHVVGRRTGSLSLISQSIDSRNHVVYAGAVLVGIIFAGFGIFIVDSLVALAVAALILKSAYDLTLETVRVARGQEMDSSAFGREYEKVIDARRRSYLRSWLLFTLKEARSRAEILSSFNESFAADGLPVVTHFGLSLWKGFDLEERLDPLLKDLTGEGLISERDGGYYLTSKGSRERSKRLWYERFT